MFGDRQIVTASAGSGFDDYADHVPHFTIIKDDIKFNWIFPQAATLNQLIISNYDFGASDRNELSEASLIINGSLIALKAWDRNAREVDRGSVWDLNITVFQGEEVRLRFRQEKGSNSIINAFVTSLTGTWLRD